METSSLMIIPISCIIREKLRFLSEYVIRSTRISLGASGKIVWLRQQISSLKTNLKSFISNDQLCPYWRALSWWGSPKKYDGKDETYFEVIHILKGGSKPANKQVERFRYRKYRSGHITIDADGPSFGNEPLDCSMNNYIDLFYTGRLEETSEMMWSKCKRIHDVISKL